MPTVAVEGQFLFVVNTRENCFEPPHVHVWVGNEDVCRIELTGGSFMDSPPPGNLRDIMKTYARYAEEVLGQFSWLPKSGPQNKKIESAYCDPLLNLPRTLG